MNGLSGKRLSAVYCLLPVVYCLLLCGRLADAADWPQFRGPGGNGVAAEGGLPAHWGNDKNVAWKVKLPGTGWSQPITWGDKIFATTAETDKDEKPRGGDWGPGGGLFGGWSGGEPPDVVYRWKVICLDAATGKTLWERTAREGKPRVPKHHNNTYASETPATDGQRLVASFGMMGLYCYDLSGKLLWSKDLGAYPMQFGWGTGSSPVLDGDRVIVQCDNDKSSFLVAMDKRTGDEIWRVARDEKSNWSTPYVWKNRARTELVTAGGSKMRSYDPASGKLLWEMAAHGRTAISPAGDDEMVCLDSYDRLIGGRGYLVAVRAGGGSGFGVQGSEAAAGPVAASPVPSPQPPAPKPQSLTPSWSVQLSSYRVASPLVYRGCVYSLDQQSGIVRCFDAKTGKEHYRQRLPGTDGFTASPWANDGKVFFLAQNGVTVVLAAGPDFKVVATNKLDDMFWSSAAVVGERLLLRGVDYLYCIAK